MREALGFEVRPNVEAEINDDTNRIRIRYFM
jgi:hypothetical protein